MRIQKIEIDGFKSYAKKVIINDFDKEFNAITGFNGTGKSNILDSICFLLGITNLQLVRAKSLQDLVYKNGQAGVHKATVTIHFINDDPDCYPTGYDPKQHPTITVARTIVIGGKNKYLINGLNANGNRVADFFRSVNLNVNNPHFLIMQGRITKVLNYKPLEILAMIEEAAGTKMYDQKKDSAVKMIERKEAKMKDIETKLNDDIAPQIDSLKKEKESYQKHAQFKRYLEAWDIMWRAYCFVKCKELIISADTDREKKEDERDELANTIKDMKQTIKDKERNIEELQTKITESEIEKKLKEDYDCAKKAYSQADDQMKKCRDDLENHNRNIASDMKGMEKDKKTLAERRKEYEDKEKNFGGAEKYRIEIEQTIERLERRRDALTTGQVTDEKTGENKTWQQQLTEAESRLTLVKNEIRHVEQDIGRKNDAFLHKRERLKRFSQSGGGDRARYDQLNEYVRKLQAEFDQITKDYNPEQLAQFERELQDLERKISNFENKIEDFSRRHNNLMYIPTAQGIDTRQTFGTVASLFRIKRPGIGLAIEKSVTGALFNQIVDNPDTAEALMPRVQRRTTFLPMTKIYRPRYDPEIIRAGKALAQSDEETLELAYDLIDFPPNVKVAMEFVFGRVLVASTTKYAERVCYDKSIKKPTVSYDGTVYNPSGVVSGGHNKQDADPWLEKLNDWQDMREQIKLSYSEKEEKENRLGELRKLDLQTRNKRQKLDAAKAQLETAEAQLANNEAHKARKEVEELELELSELRKRLEDLRAEANELEPKCAQLKAKIVNADAELKKESDCVKKELERNRQLLKKHNDKHAMHDQQLEDARGEIEGLEQSIKDQLDQINEKQMALTGLEARLTGAQENVQKAEANKKRCEELFAKEKKRTEEMSTLIGKNKKDIHELNIKLQESNDKIEKIAHELKDFANQKKNYEEKKKQLGKKYPYLLEDEEQLGKANTAYDWSGEDIENLDEKIKTTKQQMAELEGKVNIDALNKLRELEEKNQKLRTDYDTVVKDRDGLKETMHQLDEKKAIQIKEAWSRIKVDLNNIYGTLLPGTQATLRGVDPDDTENFKMGLEIKVAFNNQWKESLKELSGGQRSLVALSLVLAMLKFKPAPLYILDEVDAALDLSHTQNIGMMIKENFKNSQFIIVSLKDGMFNNANVLFRTKFAQGTSSVDRIAKRQSN